MKIVLATVLMVLLIFIWLDNDDNKIKSLQVAEALDHSQINMLGAAVDKLLNEDVYVNEVKKSYSQSKPQIKAQ
jgi:hypothetical protein